ncbi:hypothetical protein [Asticcacaulis sp.]|uniref:phosphoribosyltransferase-like protein n=1 Tax=Asticcacaulis sp. TaxID=1872648 RepID=UPI00260729BB|nr:hypothetical protein [Asticcacaulis sp.]
MDERSKLLLSITQTIKTYRYGELPEPNVEHVDRWASQFNKENQLPFLREFDYVIKQTFLSEEYVNDFLVKLVKNKDIVGSNPVAYWSKANLLRIQQDGQSQKAMVKLFSKILLDKLMIDSEKR